MVNWKGKERVNINTANQWDSGSPDLTYELDEERIGEIRGAYLTDVKFYDHNLKLSIYEGPLNESFFDMFHFYYKKGWITKKDRWVVVRNTVIGNTTRVTQQAFNREGEKLLEIDLKMTPKPQPKPREANSDAGFLYGLIAGLCGFSFWEVIAGLLVLDAVQRRDREE